MAQAAPFYEHLKLDNVYFENCKIDKR